MSEWIPKPEGAECADGCMGSREPHPNCWVPDLPPSMTDAPQYLGPNHEVKAHWETKDSGRHEEYASGMVRDTEDGKPRFALLFPEGVPYSEQMLTRFAALMARGAEKYTSRNWEKAEGEEEMERYKSSALRHLIQWLTDETDEDHAAAVMFNLMAGETVRYRLRQK